MSEVRFSPTVSTSIADYVLNHPTASPLNQYNIRFRIDSHYLDDYSNEGIKRFIDKNYNDKSGFLGIGGKDLEFSEVKAFIKSAAANAEKLQGAVFDLTESKLGLTNRDDIYKDHIKSRFTLETQKGDLPSSSVVFFATSKASFALKDAQKAEEQAKTMVKDAEEKISNTKSKVENKQWEYNQMVDFLGKKAVTELSNKDSRLNQITDEIKGLKEQKTLIEQEIKTLEQQPSQNQAQIGKLRMALIGINYEIHEREKEGDKVLDSINKKRGPLGFMGVGESLKGLRNDINNLNDANAELQKAQENLAGAKEILRQATEVRIRIQNGEDFPAPPVQPQPPVQEEPVQPAPQPQQPVEEPVQPTLPQPQQPVTPQDPNYVPVPGNGDHPPLDIEDGTQIPATPVEPQPQQPVQQPIPPITQPQPPVQQLPPVVTPQDPNYIPVPGQVNHPPLHIQEGSAFPLQPDAPLNTTPSPVGLNPYDPDTSPIGGPTNPTQPVQPTVPTAPVADPQPSQLRFYVVKRGDTLMLIAKRELGDMKRWKEIHNLNRDVIGTYNSHWIYPGQKLRIPLQ